MAETWVDGHDQHLVHVLHDFFQKTCGGCRVDDNSRPLAQRLDALYRAMQIAFPSE